MHVGKEKLTLITIIKKNGAGENGAKFLFPGLLRFRPQSTGHEAEAVTIELCRPTPN